MSKQQRTSGRAWIFFATVTGRGNFPIDMLRHDSCYPRTESDAAAIERTFSPSYAIESWSVRIVRVAAVAAHFTDARWHSFGVDLTETDD